MTTQIKFQFQAGLPTSQATSRCIITSTGDVIAEFPAGELCIDPMYPKKHYNDLLKVHGWKVTKIDGIGVFAKQI